MRCETWAALLAVTGTVTCSPGGGSPTRAEEPAATSSAFDVVSNQSGQAAATSGRVVNVLGLAPVPGVQVEIAGIGTVLTRADGTFSATATNPSPWSLTLRRDGFHTRETQLNPSSIGVSVIDLLPMDKGFDLDFFDHLFRDRGGQHTERWTEEPEFEIFMKVVECQAGELGECSDLLVTGQDAPGQFVALARDVIAVDTRKFTGGVYHGDNLTTFTPTPGTVLTFRDYLKRGKVAVIFMRGAETSFSYSWPYESGRMFSASLQIATVHKAIPFVYSHELAHALGFGHPIGSENVPLPSVMRSYRDRPTKADVLHGRILYRRPPGSRTPDRDPKGFIANAVRSHAEGLPDPLLIERVR